MVDNDISFNLTFEDVFGDNLPILDKTENKLITTKNTTNDEKTRIAELQKCLESTYNDSSVSTDKAYKKIYDKTFNDMIKLKYYDEVQDFIDIVKREDSPVNKINVDVFKQIVAFFEMYNILYDTILNLVNDITNTKLNIYNYEHRHKEETTKTEIKSTIIYLYEQKRFTVVALLHYFLINEYALTLLHYYSNIIIQANIQYTEKIKSIDFVINDAGGAGHCFYLSIAAQIYKTQDNLDKNYNVLLFKKHINTYRIEFNLYDEFKSVNPHSGDFLQNNYIAQAFVRLEFYIFLCELKTTLGITDDDLISLTQNNVEFVFKQDQLNNIKYGINNKTVSSRYWGEDFHIRYICLLYKKPCICLDTRTHNFTIYNWNKLSSNDIKTYISTETDYNITSKAYLTNNFNTNTFINNTDLQTFIEKNKDNYIILVGSGGHWQWASPT